MSVSFKVLFGIMEPAIYGVDLRLKILMICEVICRADAIEAIGLGDLYNKCWGLSV